MQHSTLTAKALHSYTATSPNQLSFKKGDTLYIHSQDASGWWDASLSPTTSSLSLSESNSLSHSNSFLSTNSLFNNTTTANTTTTPITTRGWVPSNFLQLEKPPEAHSLRPRKPINTPTPTQQQSQWDSLIQPLLLSITQLNQQAQNNSTEMYTQQLCRIKQHVTLLLCSSCDSNNSSSEWNNHLKEIRNAFTLLIPIVVIASDVCPPSDANGKMRFQTAQLLMKIRLFLLYCQHTTPVLFLLDDNANNAKSINLIDIPILKQQLLLWLNRFSDSVLSAFGKVIGTIVQENHNVTDVLFYETKQAITTIEQFLAFIKDERLNEFFVSSVNVIKFKQEIYAKSNVLIELSGEVVGDVGVDVLEGLKREGKELLRAVDGIVLSYESVMEELEVERLNMFDENRRESFGSLDTLNIDGTVTLDGGKEGNEEQEVRNHSVSSSSSIVQTLYRKDSDSSQKARHKSVGKLSKFFGESVGVGQGKVSFFGGSPLINAATNVNDTPFLGNDYKPFEISFNIQGQVNGGTLTALVERLTHHDSPVSSLFLSAFLLSFRLFTTPHHLLSLLLYRYSLPAPTDLSVEQLRVWRERKAKPIQLRVFVVLKAWMEHYFDSVEDVVVLNALNEFTQNRIQFDLAPSFEKFSELVKCRQSPVKRSSIGTSSVDLAGGKSNGGIKRSNRSSERISVLSASNILFKVKKYQTLSDLNPLETAQQFTLIESKLFQSIEPHSLFIKPNAISSNNPPLTSMSTMSNAITGWVAETILKELDVRKRSIVLKFHIKVMIHCLSLNNFNTLMAISSALQSTTITRLKKTWEALPTRHLVSFKEMQELTSHGKNYSKYRTFFRNVSPPCLPFVGLYLTDLTFIWEGNPNVRVVTRGGAHNVDGNSADDGNQETIELINFDKYCKIAQVIDQVKRFQVPYALLVEVEEVQECLKGMLEKLEWGGDAKVLYEKSLELEPRLKDMDEGENLQIVLEDAGLL